VVRCSGSGQCDIDAHHDGHQIASMSLRRAVACRSNARITIIKSTVTPAIECLRRPTKLLQVAAQLALEPVFASTFREIGKSISTMRGLRVWMVLES
jgi:hypothetical protein